MGTANCDASALRKQRTRVKQRARFATILACLTVCVVYGGLTVSPAAALTEARQSNARPTLTHHGRKLLQQWWGGDDDIAQGVVAKDDDVVPNADDDKYDDDGGDQCSGDNIRAHMVTIGNRSTTKADSCA
jgi:hypothetical protein